MKISATKSLLLLLASKCATAFVLLEPSSIALSRSSPSLRQSHRLHSRANANVNTNTKTKSALQMSDNGSEENKGVMDIMMSKVDIPDEYRDEIFQAEANTPAAKSRDFRTALYGIMAISGVAISSFNAFLTNVRENAAGIDATATANAAVSTVSTLDDLGFGWVDSNPLFSFLFLNALGGGAALLLAGLGGTMVELEQRTKNENAEKIWKELQRRKAAQENPKKKKKKNKRNSNQVSGKKMSRKNRKRLDALSEVVFDEKEEVEKKVEVKEEETPAPAVVEEGGGVVGKMKDFYKKADQMAASQALLLNKELEDKGIVDKITDETGLNVIGKEAAAKIQKDKKKD